MPTAPAMVLGWTAAGAMQVDATDPMCQPVPDFSAMTYAAWEFILLELDDGYFTGKGAAFKFQ